MHDQFCDVISYCAWSFGIGEISVHNKIVIENPAKSEKAEIREFFSRIFM